MRRFTTFLIPGLAPLGAALIAVGCAATPTPVPDQRPGDFRLGVVVMSEDQSDASDLAGGDGRYIVDSSSVLRASFGAGSTLDTFPGFTRRLTPKQMDAIWLMARDMLSRELHDSTLHAGQPQAMLDTQSGTIIEIHMNASDRVFVFNQHNQQAAAIVDALSALAWVDTVPNKRSTP